MQRHKIVSQREADFRHSSILQQPLHRGRHAQLIQTKEEAYIVGRHLKKRHLVRLSFLKRRPRFGINTQNRLRQQVSDGFFGITLSQNHHDSALEKNSWQRSDTRLIIFTINCFLHLGCKGTKKGAKITKKPLLYDEI